MKKGSAQSVTMIALLPVLVVTILIGFWVYGTVSNIVPHDRTITNETICSTCTPITPVNFDNRPVLNSSTLRCFNDSTTLMPNGGSSTDNTSLGYNVVGLNQINLTHTGSEASHYESVVCTYTYNWANTNEQGFWDSATTNTNSGFSLVSVTPIVFAAIIVVVTVLLLSKQG